MIYRLLQSVLCIFLCPLLVAQQVSSSQQGVAALASLPAAKPHGATILLRRGTIVPLIRLETISSATAKVGQIERFAVSEDVKANGIVVIPKGTPASSVVTYVRKAICGQRNGMVTVGPPSLTLPDGSSIPLRYVPYTDPEAAGLSGVVLFIAALPFVFSDMAKARHPAPEPGNDEILPLCGQSWEVATTKKIRIILAVPSQDSVFVSQS